MLSALRSLYTYAIARDLVQTLPITGIQLSAINERPRDRIATPPEFCDLLAALRPQDALPFALAGYATARGQRGSKPHLVDRQMAAATRDARG